MCLRAPQIVEWFASHDLVVFTSCAKTSKNAVAMTRRFYEFLVAMILSQPRITHVREVLSQMYLSHYDGQQLARARVRAAVCPDRGAVGRTEAAEACWRQFVDDEKSPAVKQPKNSYIEPPSEDFINRVWTHANVASLSKKRAQELFILRSTAGPRLSIDHTYNWSKRPFGVSTHSTEVLLHVRWPPPTNSLPPSFQINGVYFVAQQRHRPAAAEASNVPAHARDAWYTAFIPPVPVADQERVGRLPLANRSFPISVFRGGVRSRIDRVRFTYLNPSELDNASAEAAKARLSGELMDGIDETDADKHPLMQSRRLRLTPLKAEVSSVIDTRLLVLATNIVSSGEIRHDAAQLKALWGAQVAADRSGFLRQSANRCIYTDNVAAFEQKYVVRLASPLHVRVRRRVGCCAVRQVIGRVHEFHQQFAAPAVPRGVEDSAASW